MQGQEIERYFQDLGDELELHGFEQPIRVMVVGGVFMLLMMKNRKATEDVDVVLLDFPDMTKLTPVTSAFKAAVSAVASRHHLKRKWMNDDVAYFIMDMAPDPQPQLWRAFKKLHVYLPSREYILALKLMVFRQKDMNDVAVLLEELQVTTREEAQAIVDRFIPDKRWQEHYLLDQTLEELF